MFSAQNNTQHKSNDETITRKKAKIMWIKYVPDSVKNVPASTQRA